MIRHILFKDWKLVWPLVVLVTAIQAALEWALYGIGLFGEDPAAGALLRPLTAAWFIGIATLIVAVIQQDPVPGVDQDWLVRPLKRTHLLVAKLVFVAVAVCVPMLVFNLAHALATGFGFGESLAAALPKAWFVYAVFIVPVAALAATTRNLTELVLFGAALMVVFALSLSLSALLFGPAWCPTCTSGTAWLQNLAEHAGVLLGAGIVLALQYYRRRTRASRILCLAGAALLVFVQLPWSWAFALEQRLVSPALAAGIELAIDPDRSTGTPGAGPRPSVSDVEGAMQSVRRRVRREDAPVGLEIPVRASGLEPDTLLLADRVGITLRSADGKTLYRGSNAGLPASLLAPRTGADPEPTQAIDLPGGIYRAARSGADVQLDYSLTLMRPRADVRLAALHGELVAPEVGRCATASDRSMVYLRCKIITQSPFCFSATLVAADGRRNPQMLTCKADYRRGVPGFRDVMGFYGVDLPIRDRIGTVFPVGAADLPSSHIEFRVYEEAAHFQRSVSAPRAALEGWRAPTG